MIRKVISLLSIVVLASSEHVDGSGNRQLVAVEAELEARLLIEENEGRTELGRCGARNSCAEGLECVRVGLYKRCIPRKDCLAKKLQEFQSTFDTEEYKEMVLEKAGVTESELVEAGHHVTDGESLRQNSVMNAFIETMRENAGDFDQLGEIVKECSMPFPDEEQRRKLSDSTPAIFPTNDACPTAISIDVGDTLDGDTTQATYDGTFVPGFCGAENIDESPGVWYKFTGTGSMVFLASTCDGRTNYDSAISVYSGSCDSLTCEGGNDFAGSSCNVGAGPFASEVLFMAETGVNYFILVHGYEGSGLFGLTLTGPPSNDECSGALTLEFGEAAVGNTRLATSDSPLPGFCGAPDNDTPGIWYKFTGTGSMVAIATTCDLQTDFDTVLSVYMGSCGNLVCIAGNDDVGTSCGVGVGEYSSEVTFMAEAGIEYFILVHGFSGTGSFKLVLGPPPNDLCSGAIPIKAGETVEGNTIAATNDLSFVPEFCAEVSADTPGVWYKFTGTGSMLAIATTCAPGTRFDTALSVYMGSCGLLTCVAGNDDVGGDSCQTGAGGLSSRVSFPTLAGVDYFILVHGYKGSGQFGLSLGPPSNDECSGAISIAVGETIVADTTTATSDSPLPGFCGAPDNDTPGMWYKFTGTGSMVALASTCDDSTAFDTTLSVYMGSCGDLTCVAGNDDVTFSCLTGAGGLSSQVNFMTRAGITYFILVRGYDGSGRFGLSLDVLSEAPSLAPTDSASPSVPPSIIRTPTFAPTIEPQQTVYLGFQIEGGIIFDGLINIFWELPKPAPDGAQQTPEMFMKYCLGFGLQGGAALNFLVAVAETPDSERIECLSAFYDLDITAGVGVGYGIGVCLLEEPPFVYQEFTLGVGLAFSASGFSMCNSL